MKKSFLSVFVLLFFVGCSSTSLKETKQGGISPPKQVMVIAKTPINSPKKKLLDPSFSPLPSCKWMETNGYGIHFWSQKCEISGMVLQITPSKAFSGFIMEYGSGATMKNGKEIIRVFTTGGNHDSIISTLKSENALNNQYECILKPEENSEGTGGFLHYIIVPKKHDDLIKIKEQMKTTSGLSPCGKYGINSDEISQFIEPKEGTGILIYINSQIGTPLIDEASITVE